MGFSCRLGAFLIDSTLGYLFWTWRHHIYVCPCSHSWRRPSLFTWSTRWQSRQNDDSMRLCILIASSNVWFRNIPAIIFVVPHVRSSIVFISTRTIGYFHDVSSSLWLHDGATLQVQSWSVRVDRTIVQSVWFMMSESPKRSFFQSSSIFYYVKTLVEASLFWPVVK